MDKSGFDDERFVGMKIKHAGIVPIFRVFCTVLVRFCVFRTCKQWLLVEGAGGVEWDIKQQVRRKMDDGRGNSNRAFFGPFWRVLGRAGNCKWLMDG